jgi:hypothetical protein
MRGCPFESRGEGCEEIVLGQGRVTLRRADAHLSKSDMGPDGVVRRSNGACTGAQTQPSGWQAQACVNLLPGLMPGPASGLEDLGRGARPPRAVALYFVIMSAPVLRMVLMAMTEAIALCSCFRQVLASVRPLTPWHESPLSGGQRLLGAALSA